MEIVELIKDFGFPVACCVAMFIMLHNEEKAHKEEVEKMFSIITDLKIEFRDALNEQKADMTTAINNNTLVVQKLLDKLENVQ